MRLVKRSRAGSFPRLGGPRPLTFEATGRRWVKRL